MKTFNYIITDPVGIHARPAGYLVKEAKKFESRTFISKDAHKADMKKLFAVMGLCIKQGECVKVEVEGPDEEAAATALETFLKANL